MKNQLVNLARTLRRNQTPQERKLWRLLRDRRFMKYKFRRQRPIGTYIVDFCCEEEKIVIELDGGHHAEAQQLHSDRIRDSLLHEQGFQIVRVWNNEIDNNLEGFAEKLKQILEL